jgi:hypothetical protein
MNNILALNSSIRLRANLRIAEHGARLTKKQLKMNWKLKRNLLGYQRGVRMQLCQEREKKPSQDQKNEEGNHCRNQKINHLNTKENKEGNLGRNQTINPLMDERGRGRKP